MKGIAITIVVMLGCANPAAAQIVYGAGFVFSGHGKHVRVAGFAGGYWARPIYPYYGPTCFYPGYGPGWRPGVGNPYFLPPPGGLAPPPFGPPVFGPPWVIPAPIVVPPPVVIVANPNINGGIVQAGPAVPPREPIRGDAEGGPPGARPGQFIVIRPNKDTPAASANPMIPDGAIVPVVDKVVVPEVPRMARFDPFAGQPMGNIERPAANPEDEWARLMALARQSFSAEEYGRAIGFLDRAIAVLPDHPLSYFHKAQACLAAGQYTDALDAIHHGLNLAPDWPTRPYRTRAVYGADRERFEAHLKNLRDALTENPGTADLQFMLGFVLWFDDQRIEARNLFRSVSRVPTLARFAKLFLNVDGL